MKRERETERERKTGRRCTEERKREISVQQQSLPFLFKLKGQVKFIRHETHDGERQKREGETKILQPREGERERERAREREGERERAREREREERERERERARERGRERERERVMVW